MNIKSATRRTRNTIGSSFLTRGGDDYDHRASNKARRQMNDAVISEQLNEVAPVVVAEKDPTFFRVVITTQVQENYGTHCCECESDESCVCSSHWKAKGGNEYHIPLGDANAVLALGQASIQAIVDSVIPSIGSSDRFFQEYFLEWSIYANEEQTFEEECIECSWEHSMRHVTQEERDAWRSQRLERLIIASAVIK